MQYIIQQLEDSTAEPVSKSGLSSHDVLVRRALEMLEPEFEPHTWQAFWRMTVNGEKAREIGQEIGLPPGAVRQAKFRVLSKLREYLEGELPEQFEAPVEKN